MAASNLWTSLKYTLFLQQIYCLSPFYLAGKRLHTTWRTRAYTYTYLMAYLAILAASIFYLRTFSYLKEFLPAGFLWIALSGFEFAFTNVSFVLIVITLDINKGHQIDFLHRVAGVDARLYRHFNVHVDFQHLRQFNGFAWVVMAIYYQGLAILISIVLWRSNRAALVPFVFTYHLEQATASGLTFLVVNYALLLRVRFAVLRGIHYALLYQFEVAGDRRHKDVVLRHISVVLQAFKELTDLVQVLNKAFGLVALIRLAHDFTLLNSQLYLLFWIVRDTQTQHKYLYVIVVLVWMLPNIIKIGCTSAVMEKVLSEVRYRFFLRFNLFLCTT